MATCMRTDLSRDNMVKESQNRRSSKKCNESRERRGQFEVSWKRNFEEQHRKLTMSANFFTKRWKYVHGSVKLRTSFPDCGTQKFLTELIFAGSGCPPCLLNSQGLRFGGGQSDVLISSAAGQCNEKCLRRLTGTLYEFQMLVKNCPSVANR